LLNQIIHKLNLVSADKDPLDHRIEEQFTRSDGSSLDLSVEGIEFSFKGIPAVQVVFQDITHRKIWEAGLREEKEQATRESLAKGRFLANMSHELRTPLNAVIGLTGVMKDNENLTVVQQRNISTIRRSGEHLLDLINNILDMSKIEAEKTAVFEDTVNLTGLLSDVHDLFRYQAFKKHVSLTIKHGDNLPPWIRTDKAKLRQILTNLIGNALKFTDSGSVTVRALPSKPAETADKKMMLRIEVEDTGPGISPDQVPYIFDPFVQVGSEKKQTQGTGLGLSISRRFARLLGGDLEMEEAADGGALFNLSLPVLVLESAPEKVMETSTAGMIANHFEDGRRDDIQEVTEGTIEDGTGKMPMSQIREEIGMLPGKLRGELQAAAIQVDYMYALKLVRDMTDLNPALADALSDLIHNFKFDTLQTLCEKAD
ncbi:MAG: ATP-binding protein, partial [Desulfobacterales bacterium]|nr:ATP-binding protein [Desulfobacterales bacterium]